MELEPEMLSEALCESLKRCLEESIEGAESAMQ
jgi:hypothetical protein